MQKLFQVPEEFRAPQTLQFLQVLHAETTNCLIQQNAGSIERYAKVGLSARQAGLQVPEQCHFSKL